MLDPLPKIIDELRDASAIAAIVGANPTSTPVRVRGGEPAGPIVNPDTGAVITEGDATTPFRAFIVVVRLTSPRHPRLPIQRPRYAIRCYGRTRVEAAALAMAASDALHGVGPRVHGNGLGIYVTHDDVGMQDDIDPDTNQPLCFIIVEALATTQVVTA